MQRRAFETAKAMKGEQFVPQKVSPSQKLHCRQPQRSVKCIKHLIIITWVPMNMNIVQGKLDQKCFCCFSESKCHIWETGVNHQGQRWQDVEENNEDGTCPHM